MINLSGPFLLCYLIWKEAEKNTGFYARLKKLFNALLIFIVYHTHTHYFDTVHQFDDYTH